MREGEGPLSPLGQSLERFGKPVVQTHQKRSEQGLGEKEQGQERGQGQGQGQGVNGQGQGVRETTTRSPAKAVARRTTALREGGRAARTVGAAASGSTSTPRGGRPSPSGQLHSLQ